jgi:NADP-dependent 3-hydroxy acid dehydrogenase YdfG
MKHLLLIGVGPGNGYSLARLFGKKGFHVSMVARNTERLNNFVKELSKEKISSSYFQADIGNKEQLEKAIHQSIQAHNNVDLLIYNASSFVAGTPLHFSVDQLLHDFKVNVAGALIAAQAVAPSMIARNEGRIFITGGGTALTPFKEGFSLSIGKAGIRSLAYTLADECKQHNIHVATITVNGAIKKGTALDPDLIAQEFWSLYEQPKSEWKTEVIFG